MVQIPEDYRSDYQGELLRIRPSHDYSLIAECLSPTGAVELRFTLRVVLDPFTRNYRFRAEGSVTSLNVTQTGNLLVVSSTLSSVSYSPISFVIAPDPALAEPWCSVLRVLSGLVIGPYGGHGLEILTVQLSGPDIAPYHHPECSIGHPRLEGLKIVGDRYVPAAEFSFLIDLSSTYNIHERFAADPRPVVAFPPL